MSGKLLNKLTFLKNKEVTGRMVFYSLFILLISYVFLEIEKLEKTSNLNSFFASPNESRFRKIGIDAVYAGEFKESVATELLKVGIPKLTNSTNANGDVSVFYKAEQNSRNKFPYLDKFLGNTILLKSPDYSAKLENNKEIRLVAVSYLGTTVIQQTYGKKEFEKNLIWRDPNNYSITLDLKLNYNDHFFHDQHSLILVFRISKKSNEMINWPKNIISYDSFTYIKADRIKFDQMTWQHNASGTQFDNLRKVHPSEKSELAIYIIPLGQIHSSPVSIIFQIFYGKQTTKNLNLSVHGSNINFTNPPIELINLFNVPGAMFSGEADKVNFIRDDRIKSDHVIASLVHISPVQNIPLLSGAKIVPMNHESLCIVLPGGDSNVEFTHSSHASRIKVNLQGIPNLPTTTNMWDTPFNPKLYSTIAGYPSRNSFQKFLRSAVGMKLEIFDNSWDQILRKKITKGEISNPTTPKIIFTEFQRHSKKKYFIDNQNFRIKDKLPQLKKSKFLKMKKTIRSWIERLF